MSNEKYYIAVSLAFGPAGVPVSYFDGIAAALLATVVSTSTGDPVYGDQAAPTSHLDIGVREVDLLI